MDIWEKNSPGKEKSLKGLETEGSVVCLRTVRECSDQEERPGEEPTEVVAGQP